MLVLASERLLVRVDPLHGAEVLDLVDLESGRQLLGRLPYGTAERATGPLDELDWLAGWRGGWQVCTPNANNRCTVGEHDHGFHGTASHEPWEVLASDAASATLRWRGYGLELTRTVRVAGDAVEIEMEHAACADEPVPYAALEHVSLGLEVLDPELRLELPAAPAFEASDQDGPTRAPADAPCWPEALMRDGTVARVDRLAVAEPTNLSAVVAGVGEGRAIAHGARAGLELTWDAAALPHVWVWYEMRTSEGPFRRAAEIVAIEPCSLPHQLGLARAIEEGQARWLAPGQRARYRFAVRALPGG